MIMSGRDRRTAIRGGAVLVIAAVLRLGVLPLVAGVQEAGASLRRGRSLLAREEEQLQATKALPEAVRTAAGRVLAGAHRLLPGASHTEAQAWLVRRMDEAALSAPARIVRTEVLPPEPGEEMTGVALRIEGQGGFAGVAALLAYLEGDPVFLRVSGLEIVRQSPTGEQGEESLTFRFTVGGYRLAEGDRSRAPARR